MKNRDGKIHILHLISSVGKGGAERILLDLLQYGSRFDSEIQFYLAVINDFVDQDIVDQLQSTSVKIYLLKKKQGSKHPKYWVKLLKIIWKHHIKIIHSHDYGSKYWSILCKCVYPGMKLIYTIHDTVSMNRLRKIDIFFHNAFIYRSIAISQAVKKTCTGNGIKRVIKIYNGIQINRFTGRSKQCFMQGTPIRIVNVARINHEIKGQDILLHALAVCKNEGISFTCDLIGGIHEYDRPSFEYLKSLTEKLGLKREVHFLGGRNDIPNILSTYDLFILSSRYEGLGIALLEAMAAKLPAIACNNDGPRELIYHGQNGLLFENGNYSDLAKGIMYACHHYNMMEEMSNKAYEFVQQFDISRIWIQYQNVYNNVYGGNKHEYIDGRSF